MKIATHNGPFHADEVFATVLLQKIYPNSELVRTRNGKELANCDIVYDVGGEFNVEKMRFDHHMSDFNECHDNGIKKSSLGLLWDQFGAQFCGSDELAYLVKCKFVMAIDALDNGQPLYDLNQLNVSPVTIDDVIKMHYPKYGEPQDFDKGFSDALAFAKDLLQKVVSKYKGQLAAKEDFVRQIEASPSKDYVVLEKGLPYGDVFEDYPLLKYVISPREDEVDYMVRAVPISPKSFEVRKPFPKEWSGLMDDELQRVSGISDAHFCHKNSWLAAATSLEGAVEMVKAALNDNS